MCLRTIGLIVILLFSDWQFITFDQNVCFYQMFFSFFPIFFFGGGGCVLWKKIELRFQNLFYGLPSVDKKTLWFTVQMWVHDDVDVSVERVRDALGHVQGDGRGVDHARQDDRKHQLVQKSTSFGQWLASKIELERKNKHWEKWDFINKSIRR